MGPTTARPALSKGPIAARWTVSIVQIPMSRVLSSSSEKWLKRGLLHRKANLPFRICYSLVTCLKHCSIYAIPGWTNRAISSRAISSDSHPCRKRITTGSKTAAVQCLGVFQPEQCLLLNVFINVNVFLAFFKSPEDISSQPGMKKTWSDHLTCSYVFCSFKRASLKSPLFTPTTLIIQ